MEIDIAGKLFPNITTLVVQLCSTGIMLLIFKKFLWVPVQEYFAKRADYIESTINEAKDMKEQAIVHINEAEKQARDAALQYHAIIDQAKEEGQKQKQKIVEEAQKEARNKIEAANKEIEAEKVLARAQMKEEIVDIAMEIATKIMNKDMNSKDNEALGDEFVSKVVK